jgi:hypothetical protein
VHRVSAYLRSAFSFLPKPFWGFHCRLNHLASTVLSFTSACRGDGLLLDRLHVDVLASRYRCVSSCVCVCVVCVCVCTYSSTLVGANYRTQTLNPSPQTPPPHPTSQTPNPTPQPQTYQNPTGGHQTGRHGCSPLVSLDPDPEPESRPDDDSQPEGEELPADE